MKWHASDRRHVLARAGGAVLLFSILVGVLHFTVRDPYRVYCEDLEHEFLPQKSYTYDHPWEAFQGHPTPSSNFGAANYLTHGGPAAVAPLASALLARFAPRDPYGLALFEWRVTSLYLLVSMTALYLFLRSIGAGAALATAVACSYPFAYTVFSEWRHADLARGRLMITPVLLGLVTATRVGGYRGWLFLALTVIACMAQASQFYWIAALVAYWMVATAWLGRERLRALWRDEGTRALRHALPPLAALTVVVVALGPMYLHVRTAMRGSALLADLARDPERALYYFRDGRDWFSLADLSTLERGFLPWSTAGLCLLVAAAARSRRPVAPTAGVDRASDPSRIAKLALPLCFGSLLLAFVPALPIDLLVARDGRLEWGFAPVEVPLAVPFLFHTTLRTWLVLAEIGALVAGVAALASWAGSEAPPRARRIELAIALAVFVGLVILTSGTSPTGWPSAAHWRALAAVSAILAAVHASTASGWMRRLGQASLVAAGLIFSVYLSTIHYEHGMSRCRQGEANAAALLARDQTLLARMPDHVRGLREHRLFGEKWCYYLDAACALSYPLRTLPRDVLRFFEAADAVDDARLPYWLHLDYPLLIESGIAQMLGIRWWVLPADVMPGGLLLTDARAPSPLSLYEARGAFPKGWALESWETAGSFEAAMERVMALAAARELGRRGVVQTGEEEAVVIPPSRVGGRTASGESSPRVDLLDVEPGRLRFLVEADAPTVLATNEFFHLKWRAVLDGSGTATLRVNAAFLGVALPAGDHEVVFER